jgi:hypothetical protein
LRIAVWLRIRRSKFSSWNAVLGGTGKFSPHTAVGHPPAITTSYFTGLSFTDKLWTPGFAMDEVHDAATRHVQPAALKSNRQTVRVPGRREREAME